MLIVSSRCCSGTLYLVAVKSGTYLVAVTNVVATTT